VRTGTYAWRPTPNQQAALVSGGTVTERIVSDGHGFTYEGASTVPVSKTVAEYRGRRPHGDERFSRSIQLKEKAAAVAQRERSENQEDQTTTRRPGGRLAVFAVGTVAAFFGVAGPAFAGSANTADFRRPGASADTVQAKFQAYAGENNEVEISRKTSPQWTDWMEFRDRVKIDPHWGFLGSHGCDRGEDGGDITTGVAGLAASDFFARCGHWWKNFDELEVNLGNANDRLLVHPTTPARFLISVKGEDGNDDIDFRDGGGGDSADCGPGTDWAFGDPGDTRPNCENESLGSQVTWDPPAVASRGRDRLDVFVRGGDKRLWVRSNTGQGWSGWERDSSGLVLTSAPAAATWGKYLQSNAGIDTFTGPVDVFARGDDNALWHTWWSTTWSGQKESLGHPPTGPITSAPTVASWGPGRLDVFVRGSDNRLWQKSCQLPNSGGNDVCDGNDWSAWQAPPIGGGDLGSAPAAVSWGSDRIDVFTRGTDSNTYHVSFAGGSWGPGWTPLGGQTYGAPAAASPGEGRLYVFVRGTDGDLYRQKFANGGWNGQWEGRGGRNAWFAGNAAAVAASSVDGGCNGNGWLHVFLRSGGSGELHHLRDCPN
jgi:hypothetical protein